MKQFLRRYRDAPLGLSLFAIFAVGRVPVHRFRVLVYRFFFGVKIGKRTSVHWRAAFFKPSGVEIGDNSVVGNDIFLDGRSGLVIGDNVNIGGHVQIFTLEHDPQAPDFGVKGGPVRIHDYAYIASRATILPDVTVGEGAVVAAGAVVTRDVEAFSIVGGVPAKKIGVRTRSLDYTLDYHLPFQ